MTSKNEIAAADEARGVPEFDLLASGVVRENKSASAEAQATASRPGGARHRRKGDRAERELVARRRAVGIHADRYPLSGASRFRDSGHDIDLYINGPDAAPTVAEVKARKNSAGCTVTSASCAHSTRCF